MVYLQERFCIYLFLLIFVYAKPPDFLPQCTEEKSCVVDTSGCSIPACGNGKCNLFFTFRPISTPNIDEQNVEMELYGRTSPNDDFKYVSVAFSKDELMGDDFATVCTNLNNDNPNATEASGIYSTMTMRYTGVSDNLTTSHLSETFSDFSATEIYCRFVATFPRVAQDNRPTYNDEYYVFMASGEVHNGELNRHSKIFISPGKIKLSQKPNGRVMGCSYNSTDSLDDNDRQTSMNVGAKPPATSKFSFVNLHAVLMIIAWLGLVNTAVYSARYLRKILDAPVLGVKLWFQIHRSLNICAIVLMIGASMSMAKARGFAWTGPSFNKTTAENLSASSIHSLAGAIAIFAALLQPLNAFFRCDTKAPNRPVFDVIHRSIGLLGLLFACMSVTFVLCKTSFKLDIALSLAVYKFQLIWVNHFFAVIVFGLIIVIGVIIVWLSEIQHDHTAMAHTRMELCKVDKKSNTVLSFGGGSPTEDPLLMMMNRRPKMFNNIFFKILIGIFIILVIVLIFLALLGMF